MRAGSGPAPVSSSAAPTAARGGSAVPAPFQALRSTAGYRRFLRGVRQRTRLPRHLRRSPPCGGRSTTAPPGGGPRSRPRRPGPTVPGRAVGPSPPLYAAGAGSPGRDELYRSTDDGGTWALRSSSPPLPDCGLRDLPSPPRPPRSLYLAGATREPSSSECAISVIRSSDGGTTWTDVSAGLPPPAPRRSPSTPTIPTSSMSAPAANPSPTPATASGRARTAAGLWTARRRRARGPDDHRPARLLSRGARRRVYAATLDGRSSAAPTAARTGGAGASGCTLRGSTQLAPIQPTPAGSTPRRRTASGP